MRFFSQFPLTDYRINGASSKTSLIDIYRHVDVNETLIDDLTGYRFYNIKDGERPDAVSYELYGTPEYHWSFFVINEKLNNMNDWPRSYNEQSTYIDRKYDEYSVLEFLPEQEILANTFTAQVIPSFVIVGNLPDGNGTYFRITDGVYGEPRWLLSQPDGQKVMIYIDKYPDRFDPNNEEIYAWTIRDRTSGTFRDDDPFMKAPMSTLNDVLTQKFWTINEWTTEGILKDSEFSALRQNALDDVYMFGGSLYNNIWTVSAFGKIPPADPFNSSATHVKITNSTDPLINQIYKINGSPSTVDFTMIDDNLPPYENFFELGISVQEGVALNEQPTFTFGDEVIKYHNYFGDIDFNDPNIRLKVKNQVFEAEPVAYDSERLQLWVKNISHSSFLSNDEVTYVLDYDTLVPAERETWLNDVILPWIEKHHIDVYTNLISDEDILIDNILPYTRGSINEVTQDITYDISEIIEDTIVPDTGIINAGDFVRGSVTTFISQSVIDILYSKYLSNIEFKTSRSWLKSYNAPYNYFDSDEDIICAYDALTADPDNDNYITYFSAEEEENESKRNIRVLKDSDVESFADYYKELINE